MEPTLNISDPDLRLSGGAEQPTAHFAERLAALVEARHSQVVLGLDPNQEELLPQACVAGLSPAQRVVKHCRELIRSVCDVCVAVKPQVACFEVLGPEGWGALSTVVREAQSAGMLVIADAKRGDVPHIARQYALAFYRQIGADAVTVSPYMGRDSVEPFVWEARSRGCGVFVCVHTSNPGASDFQDLLTDSGPVHHRVASMVTELGQGGVGKTGLTDVGAVVGATRPDVLPELRRLMPASIFLLPGIGAQGGRVDHLGAAFAPGPSGALVTASRSLVDPALAAGEASAARTAAEALRETAWALAS
jgi:orotidine-5'-phosphate decarboxylase